MNVSNDQIISVSTRTFNLIEYSTFGSLLVVSGLIGLYYGCIKGNQNTFTEYMLGGKKMTIFPIAMSLISSHVSGITLLGMPAEIYEFGTQFATACISTMIVVYITNKCYLPVFYSLQLCSLFEYLEMRFSKTVRKTVSLIFAFSLFVYVPIVIYLPALAFNQVTGTPVHYITPIICLLCIFYTTIGGLKAVVWTDAIQGLFTLAATITVIILGLRELNGFEELFQISSHGERLEFFNMDPNPFSRNTFWTVTVGAAFMWITGLTVHPGSTQRFIALPTMKAAKRSVFWFGIGVCIINILSTLLGLIMYARYATCDPVKSGVVRKNAEILPHYILQVGSSTPGITGLFISGLTSAALSTMSASLNTVSCTLYEDFIQNCMPKKTTEAVASFIMKVIVVLIGIASILMVYVIEKMGEILQMFHSLVGAPQGAIFSVFALGLFFPQANSKGVICGVIGSLVCNIWLIAGTQLALLSKHLVYVGKPISIENCTTNKLLLKNTTSLIDFEEVGSGVFVHKEANYMYALSFLYYIPLGAIAGIIIGLAVSYITGGNDLEDLNPKLISPVIRQFLPKKKYESRGPRDDYELIDQESKLEQISMKSNRANK